MDLVRDLIRDHEMSSILITHDLGLAAQYCDRIMVMKDGQIVEQGDPVQRFAAPSHPYTRKLVDATPREGESIRSLLPPDPLLDPPGERARSCGLRHSVGSVKANSVVTVLPKIRKPAARRIETASALAGHVGALAQVALPLRVGHPATSMMSLMPAVRSDKDPVPAAASGSVATKALICGSQRARVSAGAFVCVMEQR